MREPKKVRTNAELAKSCRMLREHNERLKGRIVELEDAAKLVIGRYSYGCESFIAPSNCISAGRKRDAKYGADQWCDACVMRDALGLGQPPE